MTDLEMLSRCRALHAAIAPGVWGLAHDGQGGMIEARGEMGELIPVARFTELASEAEVAFAVEAPRMVGFLIGLVDRAIAKARRPATPGTGGEDGRGGKDYAAQAAIACGKPAFKKFLMEKHGLESPATDERTAQRLRGLLGVTSRRELNDGGTAAERWRALAREFEAWRKAG